ncbi:hypothetical protein BH10BAC3_BH10BAC3_31470 [soil metagenome]
MSEPMQENPDSEKKAKDLERKQKIKKKVSKALNVILVVTIATIVAEIYVLLFGLTGPLLSKLGLIIILIQFIALIYLTIRYVSAIDYDDKKDFSKNPLAVWSQIAATALIGIAGIVFTISNSLSESSRQQNVMATELMSSREKSETDFRQNIFKPLIDQIFNPALPLETRFYEFELFQNNFNDLFNSRSIYDVLWNEAENKMKKNEGNADSIESAKALMHKLIELAKYTNAQQKLLISGDTKFVTLFPGTSDTCYMDSLEKKQEGEHVIIKLEKIDSSTWMTGGDALKKDVKIFLSINYRKDKNNCHDCRIDLIRKNSVNVSYFNSPLSDNFLLPDGDRIAVILEDINGHNATISVIHFPADYVTVGYRPSIRRVNKLIDKHGDE